MKKESIFLNEIKGLLDDKVVTLGEVADKLQSKGLIFVSLLAVLPFLQPIPIPGVSTLLGLVIALQGIALIFLNKPLLTLKMRSLTLSPDRVQKFVTVSQKIYPWISWTITGAGKHLTQLKPVKIICGITLLFLSLFLSLPLPIIGSNFLPAIGIFSICVGILEEDIILIMLGNFYALILLWLLSLSYELVREQISHWTLF